MVWIDVSPFPFGGIFRCKMFVLGGVYVTMRIAHYRELDQVTQRTGPASQTVHFVQAGEGQPWRLTAGTCPHGGLVQIIFLSKWVICRFQPLIFQGVFALPQEQGPYIRIIMMTWLSLFRFALEISGLCDSSPYTATAPYKAMALNQEWLIFCLCRSTQQSHKFDGRAHVHSALCHCIHPNKDAPPLQLTAQRSCLVRLYCNRTDIWQQGGKHMFE